MAQQKDTKRGTWMFYGSCKDITGKTQRYCRRGFKTKKEAKEAEHAFRLEMTTSRPSITLNEMFQLYCKNAENMSVKGSTLYTHEHTYRNHIQDDLGSLKLTALTTPVLDQWRNRLLQKKKPNGQLYAAPTLNGILDTLSVILSYSVRLGYLEVNPCRSLPIVKDKRNLKDQSLLFWEQETFTHFISCVDDQYWRDVFMFMFGTGVRKSEMFALQWSDVDLGRGQVHISKTLTIKTESAPWEITPPKSKNSNRYIDLQDTLLDCLRRRYSEQQKKDGFSSSWFVFGHIKPLLAPRLAVALKRYIQAAGVPPISPHGFRHSHATLLIRAGVDDQLIAERLGHSVSELRKTYAHIYSESRREMLDKLNKIL